MLPGTDDQNGRTQLHHTSFLNIKRFSSFLITHCWFFLSIAAHKNLKSILKMKFLCDNEVDHLAFVWRWLERDEEEGAFCDVRLDLADGEGAGEAGARETAASDDDEEEEEEAAVDQADAKLLSRNFRTGFGKSVEHKASIAVFQIGSCMNQDHMTHK